MTEGIGLDVDEIMSHLSERRPIFHSEADFQHELAWQLHDKGYAVRLEYPYSYKEPDGSSPEKETSGYRQALDIWLSKENIAIELKYPTRGLKCKDLEGESFELRDHGGQPLRRYDFFQGYPST